MTQRYALFDFADTLAELMPNRLLTVAAYIEHCSGIRVGLDAITRAYKAVDLLLPYSSVKTRTAEERTEFYQHYNRQMFALLGVTHRADPAGLIAAFGAKQAHWELKPGARELLDTLHQRGYRIGVISNFDTRLEQVVYDHLDLRGVIDQLHISQTEGLEKPDPRFYLSFIERHGVDPAGSFYVGDSYLLDYLPASGLGLNTFLLDEAGLYPHLPEAIRRLGEIPGRLAV